MVNTRNVPDKNRRFINNWTLVKKKEQLFRKMDTIFFEHPEQEYHVRELARLLKKSPTTIAKHLRAQHKEGLLTMKKERGNLLFKANTENQLFRERKIAFNREKIHKSGLVQFLNKEYNHPEAIVLFGSYAKGEDDARSDVDIMVVTPLKKEIDLSSYKKSLQRTVQLHTLSRKEVERMKQTNKELLNNLVNGITINGFWEVFR